MTSKKAKERVDKVYSPVIVSWSRSFLDDHLNGIAAQKLPFVVSEVTVLTARYHITTIQLFFEHQRQPCRMTGQDVDMFAQVLEQCPELAHLDLSHNHIGDAGAGSLQECWCSVQRYLISISAGTSLSALVMVLSVR
jgi:hypothetical protein